jgi:hypothetical protein
VEGEEVTGFIESNADFIQSIYPTYPAWAEALALFQVACANPFARIKTRGPGLPVTFNPWAIGPSRIAYKSTPLNDIVVRILRMAGLYMFPPRFTVEGYYVQVRKKNITHGILVRDETAGMVTEVNKRYLADELTFLSELLDGRLSARVTVSHGEMKERDIRVNFATATTPHILTILDFGFWVQGLGNRLIPVYYTKFVPRVPANQEDGFDVFFDSKLRYFAEDLKKMYETKVHWVDMSKEVRNVTIKEEYIKRQEADDSYSDDKFDIVPSFYFECQVFTQKVAALKALDRQIGRKEPVIEMEDYVWAKQWIDQRFEEFKLLVDDWHKAQMRKRGRTLYTTPAQRICRKLSKYPNGLTKTELGNLTHMLAKDKNVAIKKLLDEGTIKEDTVFRGGKPVKVYKLKNFKIKNQ